MTGPVRKTDFIACANEIRKNPNQIENVIRSTAYAAFGAIAVLGKETPFLKNYTTRTLMTADYITVIQLPGILHYWASGDWKRDYQKGNIANIAQTAVFTSVVSMCSALLLDDLKFINVSKIVATIGEKAPILKFVTQFSTTVVLRSQIALGYGILGGMSIKDYRSANNEYQKTKAMIDIAQFTSQVALNVIIATGVTVSSPWVFGLGFVAYGLATTSFLYGYVRSAEINAGVQNQPPVVRDLTSCIQEEFVHILDLGKRIGSQFEGWDAVSKLTKGTIEGFKFFSKISEPVANLNKLLGDTIDLNKVTKIVEHAQKLKDGSGTYADTAGVICLTVSTLFDTAAFYFTMSNLGKPSTVFKVWKSGFFMMGLFSTSLTLSREANAAEAKKRKATAQLTKWNVRSTVSTVDELRNYYVQKLNGQNIAAAKREKWNQRLLAIAPDNSESLKTQFNNRIAEKQKIWKYNVQFFINDVKEKNGKWTATTTKMFSIVLDMGKLTLDIVAISSLIIPGIGVSFAALYYTNAAIVVTNFSLGCIGFNNFYFKQYTADAFKQQMKDEGIRIRL